MVGYPENEAVSSLVASSLVGHLETYGLGSARPVSAYRDYADLDFAAKTGRLREVVREGRPAAAGGFKEL